MKNTSKGQKQNLDLNEKIRNAGFVQIETPKLESFKNSKAYGIMKKINPKLQNLKRFIKSKTDKPRLWLSFIDWKEVKKDSPLWFAEVLIEGVIASWWTHKILGLEFGIGMIIAHGFLIKQGLNLISRIKQNGTPPTISTKN